jgi:hypothetical protein
MPDGTFPDSLDAQLLRMVGRVEARTMFRAAFPTPQAKRAARARAREIIGTQPWSPREDALLRARWTEDGERTLTERFIGRTEAEVLMRTSDLALPYTVPRGYVTVSLAARLAGMGRGEFLALCRWFSVEHGAVASTWGEPILEPDAIDDVPAMVGDYLACTEPAPAAPILREGGRESPWGWRAAAEGADAWYPISREWLKGTEVMQHLLATLGRADFSGRYGRLRMGAEAGRLLERVIAGKTLPGCVRWA